MSLKTDLQEILNNNPWQVRPKLEAYINRIKEEYVPKPRTELQNRALHLFFRQLAEHLNNSNIKVQAVLQKTAEIDWTEKLVKELLWRRIQKLVLGKNSTTELSKLEDIDKVYDHLVRFFGEKIEIELPSFPNDPDPAPLNKDYEKET